MTGEISRHASELLKHKIPPDHRSPHRILVRACHQFSRRSSTSLVFPYRPHFHLRNRHKHKHPSFPLRSHCCHVYFLNRRRELIMRTLISTRHWSHRDHVVGFLLMQPEWWRFDDSTDVVLNVVIMTQLLINRSMNKFTTEENIISGWRRSWIG